MNQPTVYIVDDDDDMRDSLVTLLEAIGHRTASFASPVAFLEQYSPAMRGCLIVDQQMPGMTGLQLHEILQSRDGDVLPVVFITAYADVPTAVTAMKGGAVDFLEKPFGRADLAVRVESALKKDAERQQRRERKSRLADKFETLTRRERETLELLRQGLPNKTIAARLDLTERAVEMRRARIMQKLQVQSVAELFEELVSYRLLKGEEMN